MEANTRQRVDAPVELPVYSSTARFFHWLTVLLVAVQIPLGFYMVWRGSTTNFDGPTNTLYSGHKLLGFLLLCLILLRLAYRLVHGAPPDEPTLAWWQKAAAHLTHWGLYALLIAVPVLGWLGVSHYGALGLFGGWKLPAIAAENQDKAEFVFLLHSWGAVLILAAIGAHFGAAMFHYFIRGDNVLRRMLPGLKQRG
ncbi:MAG: cytochrome b [Hyphomicrobiaceae bacterium]